MQRTGLQSVADILQQSTAVGSPAISRSDALAERRERSAAPTSTSATSAPQRTLILVDGQRLGVTTSGYCRRLADPDGGGRTHRSAEGRRVLDLRLRRHRRRRQHHHAQALQRRGSQRVLRRVRRRRRAQAVLRRHLRPHQRARLDHRRRRACRGRSGVGEGPRVHRRRHATARCRTRACWCIDRANPGTWLTYATAATRATWRATARTRRPTTPSRTSR